MDNFKITFIVFGMWIGVLLTGSIILELFLQGQIYSNRTVAVTLILSITGVISSAFSWWFFSRYGRSIFTTSVIICVANSVLFFFIGILVSYLGLIVLPDLIQPGTEPDHSSIIDVLLEIPPAVLGAGFSFKTFGLPLLWPFGVISGGFGTLFFVYTHKMLNSRSHH